MRILAINPLWPRPSHGTQSVNVVVFKLITELAKQKNIEVNFLKINRSSDPPEAEEEESKNALRSFGVRVLDPIILPPIPRRSNWRRFFLPKLIDFYPEKAFSHLVVSKIMESKPDVLFIPWSEWLTALCEKIPVAKFAYYGNPDAKSALAMTKFNFDHGQDTFFTFFLKRTMYRNLERLHIQEMRNYEILGDVAANDAAYYVHHGHPNAFYIQNLWIDRFGDEWREKRKLLEKKSPAIIVGNIGRLGATANTYGLELLGRDILPQLHRTLKDIPYEVHLFGAGDPHPAVVKNLRRPEVRFRGFVQDIDSELLASNVFLCMNNGSAYKVGHTRYLHAWSLGCCVVAHKDAALSMPEIVHGKNALLGETPQAIAGLVKKAVEDSVLRMKIGEGGYETFKRYFTAERVAPKIIEAIKKII